VRGKKHGLLTSGTTKRLSTLELTRVYAQLKGCPGQEQMKMKCVPKETFVTETGGLRWEFRHVSYIFPVQTRGVQARGRIGKVPDSIATYFGTESPAEIMETIEDGGGSTRYCLGGG